MVSIRFRKYNDPTRGNFADNFELKRKKFEKKKITKFKSIKIEFRNEKRIELTANVPKNQLNQAQPKTINGAKLCLT